MFGLGAAGKVMHTCNLGTLETETGGLLKVDGKSDLWAKFSSPHGLACEGLIFSSRFFFPVFFLFYEGLDTRSYACHESILPVVYTHSH